MSTLELRKRHHHWDDDNRETRADKVFKGVDEARKMLFSPVPGFKRGGVVRKTGTYKLHRGERVIPARRSDR
jgi:hypothetical protein